MVDLFFTSSSYTATKFFRDLLYAVVAVIIVSEKGSAQISPGDLSSSHAQLEGISNCTQCHTLGKTISSERCLACHSEIHSRIEAKAGLHGRNKYDLCIDCHKEHHGRDFSMRKIDAKSFDHSLTGYILKGKHVSLDCTKCHEENKIRMSDIAQKPKEFKAHTYLGLVPECSACHRDIHLGQLSPRCEHCHTVDGWKPASNFSHANAKYRLTGKHGTVECAGCHKKTLEQGTTVQYVRIEFSACSSCHADPHKGKFSQPCQSCHTTEGWNEGEAKSFNHSLTQFPLRGKHAGVKCEGCHADAAKKGKKSSGAFSVAKFRFCGDCHADAHAGQFAHRKDGGRCESCHTEESFIPSIYSVNDHAKSKFELTGAHVATVCTVCHASGAVKAKSSRLFLWKEELRCLTCHKDTHKGQFSSEPPKECEACHATMSWNSLLFTHEATKLPLRGKHASITCAKCHIKTDAGAVSERIQYRGLTIVCSGCHKDEHGGQFGSSGSTNCARCHTAASWKIENFNHTLLTRYELTGKHKDVPCGKCHTPTTVNGRKIARYKPLGTTCADCHSSLDGNEKK